MNDDNRLRFDTASPSANPPASAWLGKVLAIVLGAVAMTVGAMFSLLALVLIAGALVFALIYWKTRHWRRLWQAQMRQSASRKTSGPPDETAVGTIIEGEVLHRSSEAR
ncbi:MAG TPA: hypothetical protein PLB97_01520 [Accumulibacter sp.]|nr:hypothetical protein [Accumulibacter sp.]